MISLFVIKDLLIEFNDFQIAMTSRIKNRKVRNAYKVLKIVYNIDVAAYKKISQQIKQES